MSMATEVTLPFWRDLETFLRRTLSGYVYVILTAPLWLTIFVPSHDFGVSLALLVIVGTVVGSVIYDAWHFLFWYFAWYCGICRRLWGFNHITILQKELKNRGNRYRRAVWDAVFFRNKDDQVQRRILNLFSAAHGSATVSIAIIFSMLTWSLPQSREALVADLNWFLGVNLAAMAVVILLASNHLRLCRDAAALEHLFLREFWPQVTLTNNELDDDPP